jgi:hypothetical protein
MTSGMTIGDEIIPEKSVRPLNLPKRARTRPDIVPRTVANVAEVIAIFTLRNRASRICSLRNNSPYHRVENPPHTVASRESLNE